MGKRLIRIDPATGDLQSLTGMPVSIVLASGATYQGTFVSADRQELILEDGLHRKRRHPLALIGEIICDKGSSF
ncbi:hypothetical protein [Siphonobacter aquaeclarae]|uniref:Uncharacterized protein n=1 Tax=Siphonobacter aquaeclarae TaxID=563176 RepID=A0A1G9X247_9BACT|nr:hypothetical protein [Siphonobacter aquaeclarae]SDM90526.1 hypothetical protein SAMN04488090_4520 [Siphonobacter aquaeclarae]